MKLELGLVIAVCFSVGGMALAKEFVSSDDGVLRSIYDLEARAVSVQNQFLPISPPSGDVYVHSDKGVLPVDWKKFPKDFTKQMYAKMDANGYPIYRVSVFEDRWTRQMVFLNSYGMEVYRLDPEKDYDPYAWQTAYFQLEFGEVLDDWSRWLYDPAKIGAKFALIPQVFLSDYLADQRAQAELEASMVPMAMMMSFPATVTNLMLAIESTTNATVELEIRWPAEFTNGLEIFSSTSLMEPGWGLAYSGITTAGATNFFWEDVGSSNLLQCFYVVGNADFDFDSDGLADARELYMYNSQTNSTDSDLDGFSDYAEVMAALPTDPSDDDISAPVITIASPVNNVLVVP